MASTKVEIPDIAAHAAKCAASALNVRTQSRLRVLEQRASVQNDDARGVDRSGAAEPQRTGTNLNRVSEFVNTGKVQYLVSDLPEPSAIESGFANDSADRQAVRFDENRRIAIRGHRTGPGVVSAPTCQRAASATWACACYGYRFSSDCYSGSMFQLQATAGNFDPPSGCQGIVALKAKDPFPNGGLAGVGVASGEV